MENNKKIELMELEHSIGCSGNILNALHLHPDQQHLVYISGGQIIIRNINDSHDQRFLKGHDNSITCLAMNSIGTQLASGQKGDNSDIIMWDYKSGKQLCKLSEHDHEISILKYSEDDKLLYSCGNSLDKKMFIWDTSNGYIVASVLLTPDPLYCMCWGGFVKDIKGRDTGLYQLCTAGSKQIVLWKLDVSQGGSMVEETVNIGATYREYKCVEFNAFRQEYLYAGTTSGDFLVIQVKTKQLVCVIQVAPQGVLAMKSFNEKVLVVGCGNGNLVYFKMNKGNAEEYNRVKLQGGITGISSARDSGVMAVVTNQGFSYRVQDNGQSSLLFQNHTDSVEFITYPIGVSDRFATASLDGTIRVWDVNEYQVINHISLNRQVSPLCLDYTNEVLLTGWSDAKIRLFSNEQNNAKLIWEIENCHRNGVICIQLGKSRKFFASGGNEGEVRIWETKTREMMSHLKEHTNKVTKILLTEPNQNQLLSSSRDRALLCWDLQSEKRVSAHYQSMGGINSFDVIPNSANVLTTGQDRKITLWDLRQPNLIKQIDSGQNDECFAIRVSHDAKTFVTGGSGQCVKLWDVAQMKILQQQQAHTGCIKAINYSHDDRQVVSAAQDGNIMLWNLYF